MGQVVTNLVGNALKFTPRGGSVHVRVFPLGSGGAIEVADTGVGIDPAELPRIFERFYRGSRSNEARGSGSGLGLAIVKSIVDMHGGRVSVESLVGRGTTFTVTVAESSARTDGTRNRRLAAEPSRTDRPSRCAIRGPRSEPPCVRSEWRILHRARARA